MLSKSIISPTLFFVLGSLAFGQSYQGGIRGTVSDSSGSAIAGAKVTLSNQATNELRTTVTSGAGEYVFNTVDPATYSIATEAPSFKKFIHRDVVVATQQTVTTDVQMELGAVSQSVEVTEEVPIVESSNASNGQVIDSQKMTDLPNLGRNPFLLSKLSTNVVPAGDPRFNRFQDQSGSSQIAVAGGPVRGNNYLIDGVPITDSTNRAVIIPSIEGTQEMKIQEGTYDATMGRTGGGVFNTFLKSGSNTPHGSLLGYTRQTDWAANGYFRNASGQPRAETPFYNWAGSFGGPVWIPKIYDGRNKTFFYVVTESYRQQSPLSDLYTLPTASERAGDFSNSARTIYDPLAPTHPCTAADNCATGVTTSRTPFAGNIIPGTRINPVGRSILNSLPLPKTGVIDGVNFTGNDTLTDRADEYMAKLDQEILPWWKMNASYLHYKSREPGGNTLGTTLSASSGSPYLLYRKVDATQVNSVMTPNATTVFSLRFGFNRFPNVTAPVNQGVSPTSLGFSPSYANSIQSTYLPEFDFNNNSYSNVSPSNTVFYSRNLLGSVSKFIGRHSLTFGADYRAIHADFLNLGNTAGTFAFNGVFTRQSPTSNLGNSGLDFADALLGYPSSGSIATSTKLYTNVHYVAGYIQDDFRVSSKLTVNMGLRYEFETGISEQNSNYVVGFDQTAVNPLAARTPGITPKGVIQFARTNGIGGSCCSPSLTKWGPRIGAAYALNDKTVIRGGFGMFYAPIRFADDQTLAPGFTQTTTYVASNDGNATPANSLSNPFPNGIGQPAGNTLGGLTGIGSGFNFLDQNRTSGLVYQYSFDVQRQLPHNMMVELGYVGSSSRHLQTSSTGNNGYDINQVPNSYLSLGSALGSSVANPYYPGASGLGIIGGKTVTLAQTLRPFSEYGNIGIYSNPARAQYHSMIAKAQKRMSAGLTFLSAFTWGRNMDNAFGTGNFFTTNNAGQPQDAYNLDAEYSLAVVDTPLRWSNTLTYQLPIGKGKMFMGNASKWLDLAIGGWQVNFTSIYQTGFPLTVYQNTNLNAILGTGVQRPNATGVSPEVSGSVESRLTNYINPAAFSSAAAYTFGNVARTIPYRGPGMKNWDSSLFKDFAVTERFRAEFRAEALNTFNSPQFANPGTRLGSSSFGVIANQVNFSRLLQLGVRFAF